ncbi:MAG: hypothetical protein V4653_19845 [Pseudomonadota bacterium]
MSRFARAADRVIIGFASGYQFSALAPFLHSLAATEYQGSVVFYTGGLSRDCVARLTALGVELRPSGPFLAAELDPQLARYAMYLDCLASWPERLRFAMITDVRDVMFQSDPSAFAPLDAALGPSVHHWSERAGVDLLDEPNNRGWLESLYGGAVMRLLVGQPVSCSGISMGDQAGMLGYVARMQEEARRRRGGLRMKGIDQGIHNHLVWVERPRGSAVHANGDHVVTLGIMERKEFRLLGERVLMPHGTAPAVLHQWDRHKDLEALAARHAEAVMPSGPAPTQPLILGWVGEEARPEHVGNFLASTMEAGVASEIRLLGPGCGDPALRAFAATARATIADRAAGDFHTAMAEGLVGEPPERPVVCLDTRSTLLVDDPFRTRLGPRPLLAMEGSGASLASYPMWRGPIFAIGGDEMLKAIDSRAPVAPDFCLGEAAALRGLLGRFLTLQVEHPAQPTFALFQVAALGAGGATVTVPNFSLVANLSSFNDELVELHHSPRFHGRSCAVILRADRSAKLAAWAGLLRKRLDEPG